MHANVGCLSDLHHTHILYRDNNHRSMYINVEEILHGNEGYKV